MKKLLSLLLASLLALTPLLSLAEETPAEKLLARWSEYLAFQDEITRETLLYCDAMSAVGQTLTWEDLLRARAAYAAATNHRSELGYMTFGAPLTSEDKAALALQNLDPEAFVPLMESVNEDLTIDLLNLLDYSSNLLVNVYDTTQLELMTEWAALKKTEAEYNALHACLFTNHLLNTLCDADAAQAWWTEMDTLYPNLSAYKEPFITDAAALEKRTDEHTTTMEGQKKAMSAHVGKQQNVLDTIKYHLEMGIDYYTLDKLVHYANVPAILPMAPWWGELGQDFFSYYILDAEGQLVSLEMDSDLSVTPQVEAIYTSGVSKADVVAYADYLTLFGLTATAVSGDETDDQPWNASLKGEGVSLSVRWHNGNATIFNIGTKAMFVPDWFILLLLGE